MKHTEVRFPKRAHNSLLSPYVHRTKLSNIVQFGRLWWQDYSLNMKCPQVHANAILRGSGNLRGQAYLEEGSHSNNRLLG